MRLCFISASQVEKAKDNLKAQLNKKCVCYTQSAVTDYMKMAYFIKPFQFLWTGIKKHAQNGR